MHRCNYTFGKSTWLRPQPIQHYNYLVQVNEALAALVDATKNQVELKSRIALLEGRLEEVRLQQDQVPRASSMPNVAQAPGPQPVISQFDYELHR